MEIIATPLPPPDLMRGMILDNRRQKKVARAPSLPLLSFSLSRPPPSLGCNTPVCKLRVCKLEREICRRTSSRTVSHFVPESRNCFAFLLYNTFSCDRILIFFLFLFSERQRCGKFNVVEVTCV